MPLHRLWSRIICARIAAFPLRIAAAHFGTTNNNRDAQYVIVSPTGTNPDNWLTGGFCAWHDCNGDSTLSGGPVSSPDGGVDASAYATIPTRAAPTRRKFLL
jgi:hypothetical protein